MKGKRVRIAVMGAGSVGGYFGARLAASGQEVAFIGRGEHLKAMCRGGLKIKSVLGDLHISSLFTSDPEAVGPVDLILFCVKSYDTDDAGKRLAPLLGEKTKILSLQNGVDNPGKLAGLWGKSRTLAGVVYIAARVSTPGTIEHLARGQIAVGELDGGIGEETRAIQQAFTEAQIPCAITRQIHRTLWEKLAWNAAFCAISCLTGASVTEILESDSLSKLALECMEEAIKAAKCAGVDLEPSVVEESLSLSRGLGDFKPSMLQDLEAGKPLEYEAFNGIVVKMLRQAGKEAPINGVFYGALKFLDKRNRGMAQAS